MAQNNQANELSKLAVRFKEAIRQSLGKAWVKERYAPPVEISTELNELVARMKEEDETKG